MILCVTDIVSSISSLVSRVSCKPINEAKNDNDIVPDAMQDWKNIFAFLIGSISLRLQGLESTAGMKKQTARNGVL